METIFHNNEIWDQREGVKPWNKQCDFPLCCLCHRADNDTWWMWYHSWNNVTEDINSGARELPPIAKTYLLLLGQ
jgi:hypothetical protein